MRFVIFSGLTGYCLMKGLFQNRWISRLKPFDFFPISGENEQVRYVYRILQGVSVCEFLSAGRRDFVSLLRPAGGPA